MYGNHPAWGEPLPYKSSHNHHFKVAKNQKVYIGEVISFSTMEDIFKITLVSVAIMVVIATIAAVGLFSLQKQTIEAETQATAFKADFLTVAQTLEENRIENRNATTQIKQLQQDLQLVVQQNQTLKNQLDESQTTPQTQEDTYKVILSDINKLTLQNCPDVLLYAARQERDLRLEREELLDQLHIYERRLDEREADLNAAIAAGNQDRVRTEMERVEYMEDRVDDIRDEIRDFDDIEYSRIQSLKSRAQSWCRRLERAR